MEPVAQSPAGFGFSILTLGLGAVLLASGRRDRSMRLLGIAMLATAGTGTPVEVSAVWGLPHPASTTIGDVLLPSAAIATFAHALLSYPMAPGRRLTPGRAGIPAIAGAAVLGVAAATMLP
jgi:hypothetical protein